MSIVHEVIIRPQAGLEINAAEALAELGAVYAREPGFVESYTLDGIREGGLMAGISIWESRAAMERCAGLSQTLALREKLAEFSHPAQEPLLEIYSERLGVATSSMKSPTPILQYGAR